jgi:hypothetical protein
VDRPTPTHTTKKNKRKRAADVAIRRIHRPKKKMILLAVLLFSAALVVYIKLDILVFVE